mmetsp:Transcript_114177/g.355563  ORF Transcript_114177/g.355563 Transcript_114177/m.355563 type:complete len:166 (+) Transcript_114177:115-612(+)
MGTVCACEEDKESRQEVNTEYRMAASLEGSVLSFEAHSSSSGAKAPFEGKLQSRPEEDSKALPGTNNPFFEVRLLKLAPDEKLGMDVKHLGGRLEVRRIFPDGGVHRSNALAARTNVPGLEVGDIIVSVNDVSGIDHRMIAEIRLKHDIVFRVLRPRCQVQVPPP